MPRTKTTAEPTTVARYIAQCIAASDKTQQQIAKEIGWPNANAVSMLTTGRLKLPTNRIGALAKALSIDSSHLLRLTLREYTPGVLEAIEDVLDRPLISAREAALIDGFRALTG
ncbi:MAG: hypothetical protein ABI476_08345, partial [Oxalobacteraceae bacterium]